MNGQVIGNYRITGQLGQGGMGVVYSVEHVQLGRPAALKVLLPQMSSDPAIVQRFLNEARAAASIEHPGIVEIFEYGQHTDGRAFIVMPLLKGESLDHRLMRPLAPLEAASLIAQVASALAAAHARGIVHRDLKPDNIFLVPNELLPGGVQVKLLDFGIAKLADERTSGFRTQTGVLIGTPAYMSPEQCMGSAALDHRTDLYSVGCILYHMLCGRPPFLSDQGTGVMIAMHLRDPVPDPRTLAPHLPEPLVAITLRLLEKDPAARYQSAQELRQALVKAGAIAPSTAAGGGGAGADAYGQTMAAAPATGGGRGGGTDAYGQTAAGYGDPYGPPSMPYPVAGPSPTTRGGAAAELVTHPERVHNRGQRAPVQMQRSGGGRGVWLALGAVVLVGGGVAAAVVAGGGGGGGSSGAGSAEIAAVKGDGERETEAHGGAGEGSAGERAAGENVAEKAGSGEHRAEAGSGEHRAEAGSADAGGADLASLTTPCPAGQLRSEDTRGNCCWGGQAWSTSKQSCIGAPTCPPGMRGAGEQCVAITAEAEPGLPPPKLPAADPLAAAPSITLGARAYPPGGKIAIQFSPAVRSTSSRRAWVTVAEARSPETSYGAWTYLDDGARRASLAAPTRPGAYEIRLHTDYPARAFHVVRTTSFKVEVAAETQDPDAPQQQTSGPTPRSGQRFTLESDAVRTTEKARLSFPGPLRPARGERFWISIADEGSSDSTWGKWEYVPDGARTLAIAVPPKTGAYEVRLHANYPRLSTNVVFRTRLRVE